MPERVTLEITEGEMAGRTFVFDQHDTFLFGRAPECQVSLPDDSFVSRYHFIMEVNPPRICLRDLGSLNGTFVNGERLGTPHKKKGKRSSAPPIRTQAELGDGHTIKVGETVLIVHVESQAENIVSKASDPDETETVVASDFPSPVPGYDIDRVIGQGGMGTVYLAHRSSDGKALALKLLRVGGADAAAYNGVVREMDLLRELSHENIVRYVHSGMSEGVFFLAMEYCNKGSVKGLLEKKKGPIGIELASAIMHHVLKGLEYAHDCNLVHRDIKPDNILLHGRTRKWVAKLSDFGLAKSFDKAGLSGMTATGSFGGTCHFMPREQLTNFKYVQPVSDVWSVAATFYKLLTDQPPRPDVPGQDPISTILNEDAVPIQKNNPELPDVLAQVIDRALLTDPAARYATARELHSELRDALLQIRGSSPPLPAG